MKTLMDGDRMVAVHAEHMIGDHWWVMVYNIRFHEAEGDFDEPKERSTGKRSAAAIVRIVGCDSSLL